MDKQAASPGCPDPETISAVFDGEHEPDDALRAHLGACPECAKRLADYAVMRDRVSRVVVSEPDEGFNDRIAAFVRAESAGFAPASPLRDSDFRNSRTAWILRIAALIVLSCFFVYLLMDRINANRPAGSGSRTYVADTSPTMSQPPGKPLPAFSSEPGTGDFVKARLVSDGPSSRQYAIDIDPMLIPDELSAIPSDGRIPVSLPGVFGQDSGAMHRIPLHGDPASDAARMLEMIRRDLIALDVDVPGLSVDTESRGNSLFTTIRLESAGQFDMSVRKTDGMFEFFLMSGDVSGDDGPVSFRIEFFCE